MPSARLQSGENIETFLVGFRTVCEDVGVIRDLWWKRLVTLLPRQIACVLERLSTEEAQDFDKAKDALLRHFAASGPADCESRGNKVSAEALEDDALRKALEAETCREALEAEARREALEEARALEEEARHRAREQEALRVARETEVLRKAREKEACSKALEIEARLKAREDEARRKALDEEARQRTREQEAHRVARETEALRKVREFEERQRREEQQADFEGQREGAIHYSDRTPETEETSQGELADLKSVGSTVRSDAQIPSNDPEDKSVQPPGVVAANVEGSALESTSAETMSAASRSVRKGRRRKRRANAKETSGGKRAKALARRDDRISPEKSRKGVLGQVPS